jgi:hypothetical protein
VCTLTRRVGLPSELWLECVRVAVENGVDCCCAFLDCLWRIVAANTVTVDTHTPNRKAVSVQLETSRLAAVAAYLLFNGVAFDLSLLWELYLAVYASKRGLC